MTVPVLVVRALLGEASGQSIHDRLLLEALREELGSALGVASYGGTRSGAEIRCPVRFEQKLPYRLRRALGAALYRGASVVHRLDLRPPPGRNEVLTIHDLAPLKFRDEGLIPSDARRAVRDAAAVVSVSAFAAAEIEEWSGRRDVHVVHNGLDPAVLEAAALTDDELQRLGVPPAPIVLQSGGGTTRKNLAALAGAWRQVAAVHPEARLVLTGEAGKRAMLFWGLPRVHDLGILERRTQLGILARAAVVAVPSIYEGFGLPAVEGMALGVPVVAAARSALPEVCGDACMLVEPTADGLAGGILGALHEPDPEMIARGRDRVAMFSWKTAAQRYASIYSEVSRSC